MSIDDKLAIHEMISRYSYTYDDKDADGFAQVFLPDGVFEIFVPSQSRPVVRLASRDAIRDATGRSGAGRSAGPASPAATISRGSSSTS